MNPSSLAFRDVTKTYGSRFGGPMVKALDRVSLEIGAGEFVALMGPSGSGKTTLLRLAGAIDAPDSGSVRIGGEDPASLKGDSRCEFRRDRLGFMFQDPTLLEELTLGENIALPLVIGGRDALEIDARTKQLARELGIAGELGKYPADVSGGQRQRTAAARAVICEPALLLADEPTGALDSGSSRDLLNRIERLNEAGTTILLATHDPFVASRARRVLFLRDGRLFMELRSAGDRKGFFDRVMEVLAAMESRA